MNADGTDKTRLPSDAGSHASDPSWQPAAATQPTPGIGDVSVVEGDVVEETGTLTFAPGAATKTVVVAVVGDTHFEGKGEGLCRAHRRIQGFARRRPRRGYDR